MSARVSIIIPILDDYERLSACLEAIEVQTYPLDEVEVLIVDNGTPPARIPELESHILHITQLSESKPGSYCARNEALRHASGELLVFTDSDCLPEPDWLEVGIRALEEHRDGALIGGAIEVFVQNPHAPTLAEQWELFEAFPQQRYIEQLQFAATANAFTTRAVIDQVGPFQEKLKSGGDREMGNRIAAAGYPLVFEPGAKINHPARRSLRELLTKVERTTLGDFNRVQLESPRSATKLALEVTLTSKDLLTLGPHALTRFIRCEGSRSARARYAIAETLVHATRRSTTLRAAIGALGAQRTRS